MKTKTKTDQQALQVLESQTKISAENRKSWKNKTDFSNAKIQVQIKTPGWM